ncbi:MAG: DEAD/DEAH box helicase family protein [Clostridia bacterium]|nr:DEAD/DEAH box helicase family protein [Clostridia bacterium]
MVDIINNTSKLLGDDLREEIKSGSRLRIAASCFSIYAYAALKEELEKIEELSFLFTTPTFLSEQVSDNIKKEKREFFIPKLSETGICGTEFEIKLKNQMTQKAIARECAEWIKNKVKIKTLKEPISTQTMINITADDTHVHYTPVEGFTTADLGYERNDSKLIGIMKTDIPEQSKFFISEFDRLWNNETQLEDITNAVVDYISSCYKENSPEFIYFIILYNIFNEFLHDLDEDFMPNEATGFKNSIIWNKLFNFQKDGVVGIINKLERYNGCILADSVGLGKTFTALAVMQYYSLRNKSILVLCPKRLEQNWTQYQGNKTTNIFYKDRIRFDVLFHTDLGRTSGKSGGMDLATVNWGNYDLVVIDESHNFRNNNSSHKDKDTRYDFLMKRIMQDGVKTKVLMLSATPVNNRYNDLKNQLLLAYCGDYSEMNATLETSKDVQSIFRNAQKVFNAWSKLPVEERKAKDLMDKLDIDFSIILDSVTIARSRKHIQKFYDIKDIGTFPRRLPTKSYYPKLTDNPTVMKYKDIYDKLLAMTMNVYAPLAMLFPSRVEKYEAKYQIDLQSEDARANSLGQGLTRQMHRESGIKKLMTISLLKRLESSVYAFRLTLESLLEVNQKTLNTINAYLAGDKTAGVDKEVFNYAAVDPDDEDSFALTKTSAGKSIHIDLADIDVVTWKRDIVHDIEILTTIYAEMKRVTPDEDRKLLDLKALIDDKIKNPFNEGNRKFLIFSAFADTADYLYQTLSAYMLSKYGMYTAKIAGGNNNKTNEGGSPQTDRILTLFSPVSKHKDVIYPNEHKEIDIVIGTDCISEGQNLQDCDICINYDIHWNPVRIVQRFGRIDRIGSRNECIQLVNFWPDISLDEYINLNKRVSARMTIVNATATADDNIISDENEEMDYRKQQLKKLQEGTLQDLEDVDGNISITDLGLNDFVMDLAAYRKAHGDPKGVTKGLHAIVAADESKGIEPGIIFVLRNHNNGVNINKQNRLHPFYLVYLKDDGEVKYNHLDVKSILDALRATSKGRTEPLADLCRSFNKETKDGAKMGKYNALLDDAVASIVEVKEENDLKSLFKVGSKVLFQQSIDGIDDFELISFVVIR